MRKPKSLYIAIVLVLGAGLVAALHYHYQKPSVIYCLGDSITSGFRLQDPNRYSFPSQFAQLVGKRYTVINGGVPGATLMKNGDIPIWKQHQIQDVVNSHPDIVVVMLGTNDTKNANWKQIDNFDHDYRELLTLLKHIDTKPKIIVCSIPPVMDEQDNGLSAARINELNKRVHKLAQEMSVIYDDVVPLFLNHEEFFIDDVHPNELGAHLLAEKVFEVL